MSVLVGCMWYENHAVGKWNDPPAMETQQNTFPLCLALLADDNLAEPYGIVHMSEVAGEDI